MELPVQFCQSQAKHDLDCYQCVCLTSFKFIFQACRNYKICIAILHRKPEGPSASHQKLIMSASVLREEPIPQS